MAQFSNPSRCRREKVFGAAAQGRRHASSQPRGTGSTPAGLWIRDRQSSTGGRTTKDRAPALGGRRSRNPVHVCSRSRFTIHRVEVTGTRSRSKGCQVLEEETPRTEASAAVGLPPCLSNGPMLRTSKPPRRTSALGGLSHAP